MALMITDTCGGIRQGMPCPAVRGLRLQALAGFVRCAEGCPWR